MSKSKTHGKDKKKAAQLVLRVEKAERDAFVALCERLDTTAAREIRRFMRDMVAAHAEAREYMVDASEAPALEPAGETLNETQSEVAKPKRQKKAAEAVAELADEARAPMAENPAEVPMRRKKPAA